jgi:hypothetical protein
MVFNSVMVNSEIKWYSYDGVSVKPDMKWFNDRVDAGKGAGVDAGVSVGCGVGVGYMMTMT